jgi:uncharacterized protein YecE (DUF72 family)
VIRVGPAGWSYADWEGIVYPRRKPRGFHPLEHLARFVDCIEINSSFYALPKLEHAQRWVQLVEPRPEFRFTAKLHRDFTHSELEVADLEPAAETFREALAPLRRAGRLAALLAQFPLSFRDGARSRERLASVRALFRDFPLVLEVRHESWFHPAALEEIARLDYSLAAIDLPAAADHPPAEHPTPGRIGYLRLHGRNAGAWFERDAHRDRKYDYLYGARELEQLTQRAQRLAGAHDETYVVTNNHFEGKAVANALEIRQLLSGTAVDAPAELVERYPRLAAIARVARADGGAGQRELF